MTRALGESVSRGGLREDIRVHPLAGLHGTDGALRDLRQGFGGVRDPLTSVELFIALPDCSLPLRISCGISGKP